MTNWGPRSEMTAPNYFAFDNMPGEANGQGSNDIWFVVSPAGELVPYSWRTHPDCR